MKKVDLKERPSTYVIGRGIIIAVVLFTSSLGFILGYFVGRTTTKVAQPIKIQDEGLKNITKMPAETPLKEDQPQAHITSKEEDKEDKVHEDVRKSLTNNQKYPKSSKIVYTAFKNLSDAETLKAKFDKRGFKSFITDISLKNNEKLYRVWVGEFDTRKEAEEVSSKIKKNDGLQPFVTFKKGE